MKHAVIQLRNISKRYDNGADAAWAVRNATLDVYAGELTVLMGPSGSGKTTLLSVIGGLLEPSAGELEICGRKLSHCDELRRQRFRRERIGFVFQSYGLLSALNARENIQVALALRGSDETSALSILEKVGMEDKAECYPQQLSGGQRQRLAVARAIAGNPPVLLADEPTAALDAVQGRRVMELLESRAHAEGRAVFVVTHDPRVREFSDRVIEMEDGRIRRIVRRLRPQQATASPWMLQKDGSVVAEHVSR